MGRQQVVGCSLRGGRAPPSVVDSGTAPTLASALAQKHASVAVPLEQILSSALFACWIASTDAASTNGAVIRQWTRDFGDNVLVIWSKCLQHQLALVLASSSLFLRFTTNLFCTAKVMQSGNHLRNLIRGVEQILDTFLVFEPGEPDHECRDMEVLLSTLYHPRESRCRNAREGGGGGFDSGLLQTIKGRRRTLPDVQLLPYGVASAPPVPGATLLQEPHALRSASLCCLHRATEAPHRSSGSQPLAVGLPSRVHRNAPQLHTRHLWVC